MEKKLFVLSVDSLFFDDVQWLTDCPNLYGIYQRGSVVQKMKSTYPAMTYVAHSTMMTGCHEEKHGIYHNEKVEVGEAHPAWHWYRRELGADTIFDAAKKGGYSICVVNWPVTGGDPSIDYLVPEIWSDDPEGDSRPRFLTVCSQGIDKLYDKYGHMLRWKYQPELDDFGVACLKDIIREHEPDVIMLHLSYLDHARHNFGGFSPEAKHALMECDRKIGELMEILREKGLLGQYNICVMGDHGHLPVKQVFNPNILLAEQGLMSLDHEGRVTGYKCYIHSAGLSAHVVLKDPKDQAVRNQVEMLLNSWTEKEEYGCEQIFNKAQMEELHLKGPFDYVIEGRLGTSFGNKCTGPVICPTDNSDYKLSVSAHGHLPDKGPQPIFFAAGPDIRKGVVLECGDLIDEAPTYAAVLGVEMPWAQGKAMKEILKQEMNKEEESQDMRKRAAIVLAAGMAAGLLAGCGSGENAGTAPNSEPAAQQAGAGAQAAAGGERVNIEFWHCMGSSNGELIQEIVDSFNESQDKVYVKSVHQGSYTDAGTKMQAALAAGEAPVLAQMEIGMLGIFADAEQLVDLQKFVDAESYDIGDFMPGLMDASYYNDALVALPHSRSVPVLYYNKDRFEAAGLDAQQPPVTWDDLKEVSGKLTADGTYGYSCPLDQWYYMSLVMNAGGTIFNEQANGIGFEGESGTKPLYLWKEMIADGTMHVPSGQDYNSSEACRNAFAGGTAAMVMQSSAQLKGLEKTCEFQVGVGAVPKDSTLSYPAGGSNLLMFKGHTEEEEAAGWEFLKFMTNTENALKWANGTGYLPTRTSCMESDTYKKMIDEDPNLQIIVEQVEFSTYKTPFIPQYQEAKEVFANEIQKCILEDDYTPEQAVESMKERVAKLF